MGKTLNKIGVKLYNAGVRSRNKLVNGDYHVANKAGKVLGYATRVGQNIADDVSSDQMDAFPFKLPTQTPSPRKLRKEQRKQPKAKVVHHHHYYANIDQPKKRKRHRRESDDTDNPWF